MPQWSVEQTQQWTFLEPDSEYCEDCWRTGQAPLWNTWCLVSMWLRQVEVCPLSAHIWNPSVAQGCHVLEHLLDHWKFQGNQCVVCLCSWECCLDASLTCHWHIICAGHSLSTTVWHHTDPHCTWHHATWSTWHSTMCVCQSHPRHSHKCSEALIHNPTCMLHSFVNNVHSAWLSFLCPWSWGENLWDPSMVQLTFCSFHGCYVWCCGDELNKHATIATFPWFGGNKCNIVFFFDNMTHQTQLAHHFEFDETHYHCSNCPPHTNCLKSIATAQAEQKYHELNQPKVNLPCPTAKDMTPHALGTLTHNNPPHI